MKSSVTNSVPRTEQKGHVLINRNFALLWSGQGISLLGDVVFNTTLVLWIATTIARGQPWASLAVSGIFLATSVPTLTLGPFAGVFVDRWSKRSTMIYMDLIRAFLILLLLFETGVVRFPFLAAPQPFIYWQLGGIYAIVFLVSCCSQFFNPSRLALLGEIVSEPQFARASSMVQVSSSVATILGPALATLIFFRVGIAWALILDAFSFVISFLGLLMMRVSAPTATRKQPGRRSFLGDFKEGIQFSFGNRIVAALLLSGALIALGSVALSTLDIFFVTQNLHASSQLYGVYKSTFGAGAIVGAILAGLITQRLGVARTFWSSMLASGVAILILAQLTNFIPALSVLLALGILIATVNVAATPLILHATPPQLIGRVMAVFGPATSLAGALSAGLAGYLDSSLLRNVHLAFLGLTIGPLNLIYTGAGIFILAGGLLCLARLSGVVLASEAPPSSPQ